MFLDALSEFVEREKAAAGREEKLARYVDRAGNVTAPRTAPSRAGVLFSVARVHNPAAEIRLIEDRGNVFGGCTKLRSRPWCEDGLLCDHITRFDRASLIYPFVPSPVQHADLV